MTKKNWFVACVEYAEKNLRYPKPKQRTPRSVLNDLQLPHETVYKNFKELCQLNISAKELKGLASQLKVFGRFLLEDRALYLEHLRSRHVTVSGIKKKHTHTQMNCACSGVHPGEPTSKLFHHVIPLSVDPLCEDYVGQLLQ